MSTQNQPMPKGKMGFRPVQKSNVTVFRKRTPLTPEEEKKFQSFYADIAKKSGINPNPDDPRHQYDYRGAWKSGAIPAPDPTDNNRLHWPSQFKDDDHPRRILQGIDTRTGRTMKPDTDIQKAKEFFDKNSELSPELLKKGHALLPLTKHLMGEILAREGYGEATAVPHDTGGLTKYGVAQNYNAEGLALVGKKSVGDLTPADAALIFQEQYLKKTGLHQLKNRGLASFLYDTAINPGPSFMPASVRRALGIQPSAKPISPQEAEMLNKMPTPQQDQLLQKLNADKINYREAQQRALPEKSKFMKGWMDRYDDTLQRSRRDLQADITPEAGTSPVQEVASTEPRPESAEALPVSPEMAQGGLPPIGEGLPPSI